MGMLVLGRRAGQKILIGDDIVVKIVRVKGDGKTVMVGIEAPVSVPVDRQEVRERVKVEGRLRVLKI